MTRKRPIEVAHIFPHYLLKKQRAHVRAKFWATLSYFWSEDQIKAWQKELLESQETSKNLICLRRDAHALWHQGQFALKPNYLSADQKTLEITFYWQAKLQGECDSNGDINLLTQPQPTKDLDAPTEINSELCRKLDNIPQWIKSGDTFTLTTDDPINRPLPSF